MSAVMYSALVRDAVIHRLESTWGEKRRRTLHSCTNVVKLFKLVRLCGDRVSSRVQADAVFWSLSCVDFALCFGLLSYWKIVSPCWQQVWLRDLSAFCCIHFALFLYKLSGFAAEKHPHSMMMPLPALMLETVCFYLVCGDWHSPNSI